MNPAIQVNRLIQTLAAQRRLNFWLGPGCSAGVSYLSDADILRELRRRNADLPRNAGWEEAFLALNREQRGMFVHMTFGGMNWTYPCLAALAAKDRVGAIVLRNVDGLLPRLLASRDLLPPLLSELVESSETTGLSALTLFELPAIQEPTRWSDAITQRGAGNPWVVAGVSKPRPAEIEILKEIAAAGTPVYWISLWNAPAPVKLPMQLVSGFDPDSFFAALAQATVGFPPCGWGAVGANAANPEQALQQALGAESETLRRSLEEALPKASSVLQGFGDLDDAAFSAKLDEFQRTRRKLAVLVPSNPNTGGIELFHAAKTTGGRRADTVLALAAEQHRAMLPRPEKFAAVFATGQWVGILHARAKLRRPAEAQAFYEEAYRTVQSLPSNEPRQWQVALDLAHMLEDWAATKDTQEAEPLVREAIDILDRPRAAGRLKPYEQSPLWTTQAGILRKHALRLDPEPARKFFREAKECCEPMRAVDPFMAEYTLGMIAFEEARNDRAVQAERIEAGNRYFAAALEMKPSSAGLLHMDWGTVFASIARDRDGVEADALFAQAFEHFAKAAEDANAASSVHNNWSAFLLVQARRKSGAEHDTLLSESWTHARATEAQDPTKGAYNLACIAAEREDWETMSKWLRISARGPRYPPPAHTDSVTSFNAIRSEAWFQKLLEELYP